MILRLQSQELKSQGSSKSREAGQIPHGADSVDPERRGSSGEQRVLVGSEGVEASRTDLGNTHVVGASGGVWRKGSTSGDTTTCRMTGVTSPHKATPVFLHGVVSSEGGGSVEGALPRTDLGGGAGRRAPAAGRGQGQP